MRTAQRCRRCRAELHDGAAYCTRCGTRQVVALTGVVAPGTAGSPAWSADPFGRHEYRYFDGAIWTEHVFDVLGGSGTDRLSIDHGVDVPGTRAWRASVGSLALTFGGILGAFALSIALVYAWVGLGRHGGIDAELVVSEAGLWAGFFSTCVITSRRYGSGRLRDDFGLRFAWNDVGIGLLGAFAARCLSIAVIVPIERVHHGLGNPDAPIYSVVSTPALGWFVLVAVTCVGAPFFEELLFRGLLQGQLVERIGPWAAVPLTSVVFGAVHIANDPGVAGLILALSVGTAGLVLGAVRLLTGRLGASMASHAAFNATAVVVLALTLRS